MNTYNESEWLATTLNLLRNRPVWLTLTTIAIDTGVPVGWIKELSRGAIKEPSVVRIQALHTYLSDKAAK